jgi:hypothetical protein
MTLTPLRSVPIPLLAVLGFGLVQVGRAQEQPATMMRISTRIVEPRPDPGSFAAQPKVLWRAGTNYGRVAESPDIQHRVQGLMIINEPDAWMINLFDKSGTHMIDPGPSLDVHLPIFTDTSVKTRLKELEFGRELKFFAHEGAQGSAGEPIGGGATERYQLTIAGGKIVLWTDFKSKKPLKVSLVENAQSKTIEYLSYDDNLAFNPSLFQAPAGIAMQNAK